MTASFITVNHTSKSFHNDTIFNDLSFTLSKGEILSIVGPSGSGKTTLLRCLAGLEPFTEGTFIIDQQEVTNLDANKRPVSLVFQHPLLFPHMTIAENVAYGLSFQRIKKKERMRRAQELINQVGLTGYEKKFPYELSGGQQQRVSLARSLAISPQLLLLDEPFSSLDVRLRGEMRAWVRQLLKDQAITAVFVTHDREEAMEMGDYVGVFENGQFQQIGEPEHVYHVPANAFVADFFGDHLIVDKETYIPVQSLFLSKSTPHQTEWVWKGTMKNKVHIHGHSLYQIFIADVNQQVTVSSSLGLQWDETVYVSAHPDTVHTFTNLKQRNE
ncbi:MULTISPECIES: ABC transporter ATP-binding protein [Pontibacillus]|uniref:ABC transporter ATP-binding protein n=1 Tax=Pontibacillus chungwhensis TaxID=265426 RepID=A0ABY8UZB5_9BACI|nr:MULTISPECIES: ABC transporter ATP-binding protein [Pontibacillus]MCD5325804.1 ABC transporter ATP-binding protein [Pontibacillus sp. HN14]WIF98337.1 ABC transporter ATP-binding protein [Pontibacillus chungwhensis]